MKAPKITVRNRNANYPGERIVEFSFPDGSGGLISFCTHSDGTQCVELYRVDHSIVVRAPGRNLERNEL